MSIELYIKNERSLYIDTIEKLYKQIICEIIKNNKYIDKIYIKKARKKKKKITYTICSQAITHPSTNRDRTRTSSFYVSRNGVSNISSLLKYRK